MSFEVARAYFKSRDTIEYPVSVSFRCNGPGKPRLFISMSRTFTTKAQIMAGSCYELMIGKGPDKGKLMLIKSEAGAFKAKVHGAHGAAAFNCGHIEQLGLTARDVARCKASITDAGDVMITLPKWEAPQRKPELKLIRAAGA